MLQGSGLLLGALRQIVGGGADFVGVRLDASGVVGHLRQSSFQLLGRIVEIVANLIKGFRERGRDTEGHVAIGKMRQTGSKAIDCKLYVRGVSRFLLVASEPFLLHLRRVSGFLLLAGNAFPFGQVAVGFGFAFEPRLLPVVVE